MLELADINSFYGKAHVLNDLSLSVKAGQVVVPAGPQWRGQDHNDEIDHATGGS